MLRFTCIQRKCVCVLCFCFVKVKFVFLSNITTFIYLRACYVFFFFLNQKEKEKLTNKTHTREKCFVVHFSGCVTESRPVSHHVSAERFLELRTITWRSPAPSPPQEERGRRSRFRSLAGMGQRSHRARGAAKQTMGLIWK